MMLHVSTVGLLNQKTHSNWSLMTPESGAVLVRFLFSNKKVEVLSVFSINALWMGPLSGSVIFRVEKFRPKYPNLSTLCRIFAF